MLLYETGLPEEFVAEQRRRDTDIETIDADLIGGSRRSDTNFVVGETHNAMPEAGSLATEHEDRWVGVERRMLV